MGTLSSHQRGVSTVTSNERPKRTEEARPQRRESAGPKEGTSGTAQVTHSDTIPTERGVFTKAELAKHLKVSIRTITDMMRRGELAYIKINGRLVRFRLEDVHARLTETCLVCHAPGGEGAR